MTDSRPRTPRTLLIPDHLWQAFEAMASEMGTDREGLVSQALYTFARLNGFLLPHDLARLGFVSQGEQAQLAARLTPPRPAQRPLPAIPSASSFGGSGSSGATLLEGMSPPPRPRASPPAADRMAEIERQLASQPVPVRQVPAAAPSSEGGVEVDDSLLGEDGVHATSMELPNLAGMGLMPGRPGRSAPLAPEEVVDSGPPADEEAGPPMLVLLADGRELDRVVKDRFLIGRGKHCDLIINSGKVSREHAAITHEGPHFFIEDLGSSNGTWFDKRRIGKRQIVDGDEYFICAEKLTCQLK